MHGPAPLHLLGLGDRDTNGLRVRAGRHRHELGRKEGTWGSPSTQTPRGQTSHGAQSWNHSLGLLCGALVPPVLTASVSHFWLSLRLMEWRRGPDKPQSERLFFMRISENIANLEGRQDFHLQGCSPQTLGLLTRTEQRSPFLELLLIREDLK